MPTPTKITANIATWVKDQRTARGLSGAELARQLVKRGIPWNRTSVVKLETGRRCTLTVDELVGLASVLGALPEHMLKVDCANCGAEPPTGYTCNTCGRTR